MICVESSPMAERLFLTTADRKLLKEADRGELFEFLPFSDFRKWVSETSIYIDILSVPAFARTAGIRNIPLMSYQSPQTSGKTFRFEPNHNRIDHSLVVPLLAEAIGRQNKLSPEKITILILGGAFHDVGTPAFGDTLKQLDPNNLDEEDFWWESLREDGQNFITQFYSCFRG